MSVSTSAEQEIVDFIVSGTTPESIIRYRPSEEATLRLEDLIEREKGIFHERGERVVGIEDDQIADVLGALDVDEPRGEMFENGFGVRFGGKLPEWRGLRSWMQSN